MANKTSPAALRLTISIFLVIFGFSFCNTSMSTIINMVIDEFGLAGAQQGLPGSVIQIGSFISVLLVPLIGGKVAKTTLLGLGAVLQAVTVALTGASPAFFLVLVFLVLMGGGGGLIDVLANAIMIDIHGQNSARYLGVMHGFYSIGSIITPLIIQAMLPLGWRRIYLVVAIPLALAAVFFIYSARTAGDLHVKKADAHPLNGRLLADYLKNGTNLALAGCFFCYSAGQFGMMGWLVRYMTVQFDAEPLGALGISLFWGATTLNRFIAPRLGIKPMTLVVTGLGLGAVFHAIGVFSGNPIVMLAAAAAVGLVSGHTIPMLLDVAAKRNAGNTTLPTSVLMLCNKLAMTVMPLALGATAALTMGGSMLLGAIAMGLGALFALPAARAIAKEAT